MARYKLGKKPSRNRFFCWKTVGGERLWFSGDTASGYSKSLARRKPVKAALAREFHDYHGMSCKIVKYNSKTGQLEGSRRRRRRR